MFREAILFACLALCHSHAVLPVVPAAHALQAPVIVPYPLYHGYAGHGYAGYGYAGHGLVAKPLAHHLLKRSPHIVAPIAHTPFEVAPVAVSHQSRVDLHTPVVAPVYPLVKPVVTPFVAAPLLHKPLVAAPYYGVGGYGVGGYGVGHHGSGYLGHY